MREPDDITSGGASVWIIAESDDADTHTKVELWEHSTGRWALYVSQQHYISEDHARALIAGLAPEPDGDQ